MGRLPLHATAINMRTAVLSSVTGPIVEAVDTVRNVWSLCVGFGVPLQAAALQRSMGLKMEQLKAELKQLMELHAD